MVIIFLNNSTFGKTITRLESKPDNLTLNSNECIIDEEHPLFEKTNDYLNHPESGYSLEPVVENNVLVDLKEVPIEPDHDRITMQHALENLNNTDYQVIKNMEVLMDTVAEAYGIELPYKNLHEKRQKWRNWYNDAEEKIRKREKERYFGKEPGDE